MMQLGVVDFLSFSRVCKSWRSFALSNRNNFMSSRPPMFISISRDASNKNYCTMRDFEQKKFKTILSNSVHMTCYGLTCGYLIMFGNEGHDFWLVNPITRHELHFPPSPFYALAHPSTVKGILVFLPSISRWAFVISYRFTTKISYFIKGKRGWNHVSSTLPILDLHAFKGKIYTIHADCCLCEMRLNPKPKLKLLETKNFQKPDLKRPEFVTSGEKLYIMNRSNLFGDPNANKVLELDFGEMKWVSLEKTIEEYAFFLSNFNYSAAIKKESWAWADPRTQSKIRDYFLDERYLDPDKTRPDMFFYARMWYFSHDCFSVDLIDER
ncbi:hypothetical protein Lser_V15G32527 [Lactuca serriola]